MELANPGNQTNEIHKTEIADSPAVVAVAVGSAAAVGSALAVAVSAARHDGRRVWTKKNLEATSAERASEREREQMKARARGTGAK
jgi:hypothetical protein